MMIEPVELECPSSSVLRVFWCTWGARKEKLRNSTGCVIINPGPLPRYTPKNHSTAADNAESRALIAHRRLGHVSEKKVLDTSKVAENVPSSINRHIHCTSCSKGKMHIMPHSRNAWVEKAKHRHDAWHLDLIGKFRVPSLGGNSYVLILL